MAEEAKERCSYLVKFTHPDYGLLQGTVDHEMFSLLQAKDPSALAQFVNAVKPKNRPEVQAESPNQKQNQSIPGRSDGKWSANKEDALLQAYHDLQQAKPIWSWAQLAGKFSETEKEKICGETARLKIRSLKDKYHRLDQHNKKTGNDPVEIPEWLETAFGTQTSINVKTLENTETAEKTEPPSVHEDNVEDDFSPEEIGAKRKRTRTSGDKVGQRQTGAQMVINELRVMKEEDRKVHNEQFNIKCELAKEMIQAIKGLKKDD